MKFFVENKEVLELSATQQKVIQDNVNLDIFVSDMERRVNWVISHKYDMCYDDLIKRWLPKLRERYDSLPTSKDALAELIFAQPDYKPIWDVEIQTPGMTNEQ
jgi:hypothetical protein